MGYHKGPFWDLCCFSYVNDIIPQAVKSNLFLYADNSCLVFQGKEVIKIEKQSNNFTKICEWFADNRLSFHFDEDKTKSILFVSERKIKKVQKTSIKKMYKSNNIQRFYTLVAY